MWGKWKFVVLVVSAVAVSFAWQLDGQTVSAQETPRASPTAAKTKLEAFEAKSGVVIVRGFSPAGSLSGQYDTSVEVECKEFIDAGTGTKQHGISVQVRKGKGRSTRKSTSYIDYDEIESLLQGIEYIAKIDKSVTKLANFQADYRTKGDLAVSTYSTGAKGTVGVGIKSGTIGGVLAFLDREDLTEFRNIIAKARDTLDELRK